LFRFAIVKLLPNNYDYNLTIREVK